MSIVYSKFVEEITGEIMSKLFMIGYIILGLLQMGVICAGFESWFGLSWVIAAPLSGLLAYFPLVGTVIAFYAAIDVWHWHWYSAVILFGLPIWVLVISIVIDSILKKINSKSDLLKWIDE